MAIHDPYAAAVEFREQLASDKRRIAFLLGAGTSMAVGLPGLNALSQRVADGLDASSKRLYDGLCSEVSGRCDVEHVLSRLRIYRELMGDSESITYAGIAGATAARDLDKAICHIISSAVSEIPEGGTIPHQTLAHWLRTLYASRDWPAEIFTTNYDLLIECALENIGVPFFDGFIGSVSPFFAPESVEAEPGKPGDYVYPPRGWTRVSKLHGSINWCVKRNGISETIHRFSGQPSRDQELMIYPSREKYVESRKQPFITFQDHLRRFLACGECMLVISGYSFCDQHLNEIVLQGLRSNPRLAVTALVYGEQEPGSEERILPEYLAEYGRLYTNLTVYGPDKACIGGVVARWQQPRSTSQERNEWPFWDDMSSMFTLGDFHSFAGFLEEFIRFQPFAANFGENAAPPVETATIHPEVSEA